LAQASTADYVVHGVHLRSEVDLPELAPVAPDGGDAVEIRLGDAGADLPEPRLVGPAFQAASDDCLLDVPMVARYRIRDGRIIIVEPKESVSPRDVRLFLLGPVFGALCQQRGLLPLHASAIAVEGRCVAFAGRSRAGKSTLAGFFSTRGYDVLADDMCVVSRRAAGPPLAWPSAPKLKL